MEVNICCRFDRLILIFLYRSDVIYSASANIMNRQEIGIAKIKQTFLRLTGLILLLEV